MPMNAKKIPIVGFDPSILPDCGRAWIVGGSVRDLLRGSRPTDIDIVVEGDAARYAGELSANTAGRLVNLGKAPQIIHRVVTGDFFFDICRLNGSTIKEDLFQRDFCINAMAIPLPQGELMDCFGGLADLESKRVRMVTETGFAADPLRLLRAFRLVATLGFTIEEKTMAAIAGQTQLIRRTAGERIREELMKILAVDKACHAMDQMASAGLLGEMMAQLGPVHDRLKPAVSLDSLRQGLAACQRLEWLLLHPGELSRQAAAVVLNPPTPQRLKLAALVTGFIPPSFISCRYPGALPLDCGAPKAIPMVSAMARRFKLSHAEQIDLTRILGRYWVPKLLFQARQNNWTIVREVARWFRQSGKMVPALLVFAMAHETRAIPTPDQGQTKFNDFCREMLHLYFNDFLKTANQPPLVSGHDLIENFGLAPCALFKTILDAVEDARLAHQMNDRAEAIQWIGAYLNQHGLRHSS
jgi:tRNA nucleotidyltransferase/poly(A) polymerase